MATGKNIFKDKQFTDEDAAREWFEAARWPYGPVCPHCGSLKHYATKKAGRYRCGEKECRKDYTVMTKSVMERSHAKLTQWAMAFHLYASSRKGFTASSSSGCWAANTTPRGFFTTASWKQCAAVALIFLRWAVPARLSRLTRRTTARLRTGAPSPQRKGRPYITKGSWPRQQTRDHRSC